MHIFNFSNEDVLSGWKWIMILLTVISGALAYGADWRLGQITEARLTQEKNDAERRAQQNEVAIEQARSETAKAQLETAQIKERVAWRAITQPQGTAISAKIAAHPGTLFIEYVSNDPEALGFAIQLQHVVAAAGWKFNGSGNQYGSLIFGIFVPDNPQNPDGVTAIRDALTAAGISFSTNAVPAPGTMYGGQKGPTDVDIIIGSKLPIF